jgi:anti-sigma-K factor RskA
VLRPATALAAVAVIAAGVAGYLIRGEEGPMTRTVRAQATAAEPGARATLVRYAQGAVLRVERLPVQRRGRVYQVWLARGKRVEPSSLFAVRSDGTGAAAIPSRLAGVQAVMVSQEPEGGSAQPTTKPVLVAKL